MKFSTPVTDFGTTFCIEPQYKILMLGSCFANVVGQRLADYRMRALLNPVGTLYNPNSIFNTLDSAIKVINGVCTSTELANKYTFEAQYGRWYSWMAASCIKGDTQDECTRNMATVIQSTAEMISKLDVLILTFGTDHFYALKENPAVAVANCHKMPSSIFEEKIFSLDEIIERFDYTYSQLKGIRPDLKIILTVSPYRYIKYGLHQSQLSKSRLLLAVDECQKRHRDIYYFPAYEILNDELRDYRFYAADMVHPSEVAEEYIWQAFCNNYISERLNLFFKEWTPILKAQAHRQLSSNEDSNLNKVTEARLALIREKFPEIF